MPPVISFDLVPSPGARRRGEAVATSVVLDVCRDVLPWQLTGTTAFLATVYSRPPGDGSHTTAQEVDISIGPLGLPDPLGSGLRQNTHTATQRRLGFFEVAGLLDLLVREAALTHFEEVLIPVFARAGGLCDGGYDGGLSSTTAPVLRKWHRSCCRQAITVSERALAQSGLLVGDDALHAVGQHGKTGQAVASKAAVLHAHSCLIGGPRGVPWFEGTDATHRNILEHALERVDRQ
jgi:hypothetical protein